MPQYCIFFLTNMSEEERIKNQNEKTSADILESTVLDWRNLKSKRQKRRKFKDYQEQLLKETPGAASRVNVAMHAVIDVTAEGCENKSRGMGATAEIRNQALIHYVARLASSNNDHDEFDFSFVESLLENGADINAADKYGQTIFHEVARSWNVDVARFLLNRGANINQQDRYGRAPLHVASAVDYTEMIEFLLIQGAKMDITTFGELQTPIHFATKNDACEALKLLINYGANINCRDYQNRTPLQVAASMSRSKAARFLVELGAPSGVYDHNGEMTLSLLILKMPEVAILALDQFRSQDMINRKEYYFLNYVEGPRTFEKDPRENKARSPLEIAIQHENYGIIMHPVMKRLIKTKWDLFGKKGARVDLVTNVIFAFVWTILGITLPLHADRLYSPLQNTWWRLLTALITILLTCLEGYKQVSSLIYINKAIRRWKTFRERTLKTDKQFCHPKWRDENEYLDKEIKAAREERFFAKQDGWIILDWILLILITSGLTSHLVFLFIGSKLSRDVHVRIVSFLLIVLWIRLLKFTRPFEEPGPFVASIAPMLRDFCKWSLLFCLLFIPYAAIFWMIFGPVNKEYTPFFSDIPGLLFSVFTMAAFSNLSEISDLAKIDQSMARLLTSSFVAISTIVTLNLLIAMLADTFTRMYENSLETASMQRAKTILYLEQSLSPSVWQKYCEHVHSECSPEVTSLSEDVTMGKRDKNRLKENLHQKVDEIHTVVRDRFAKQVGTEKSDMDRLLEGVNKLNDNLVFALRHMKGRESDVLLADSSVLKMNIVLKQPKRRTMGAVGNKMPVKAGAKRNKKTPYGPTKDKGGKTGKSKIEESGNIQPVMTSLARSSQAVEESLINQNMTTQLDEVLDMMKNAINKGKLHFRLNGKTLVTQTPHERNTAVQLHSMEDTGTWTGDDEITSMSEKDWAHYETHVDGEMHGIMNPSWSVNMEQPDDGTTSTMQDTTQESSLDTSDEIPGSNESPVQSPGHSEYSSDQISSFNMERQRERHEDSSFLSSSTEHDGNISWDDVGHEESESSHSNASLPVNALAETRPITSLQHQDTNQQYSKECPQLEDVSLQSENSDSQDNTLETRSQQLSKNCINGLSENINETYTSCHNDTSSSQASFVTNHYSSSDNTTCTDDIDLSSTESVALFSPSNTHKELGSTGPHVRWADTADDPCGTRFLNIREISTSPSDNSSADNHLDSETASEEDSQPIINRYT